MALERDKGHPLHLVRAQHPARKLGRQGGLAFAALAAQHRVGRVKQQPLQRQQLAAAADEASVLGRPGQVAGPRHPPIQRDLPGLRRRQRAEELRIGLFLEQHRDEPVL